MKTSKLKFVVALLLLVVVSVVSANVKALSMPSTQMKVSVILSSRLSDTDIVDGDDPEDVVTVNQEVLAFNTPFYGVAEMNPMQTYSLRNYTDYLKAYSMAPGYIEQGTEYENAGTASQNIGLALAAADTYSYSELQNLEAIDSAKTSRAAGVQAYVWAQTGAADAYGQLDGTGKAEYDRISNLVNLASLAPSYAGTGPIEMQWNEANQRYEVTLTDANGLDMSGFVRLNLYSGNSSLHFSKNGNSVTFYSTEQIGSIDNPVQVRIEKSINGGWYGASTVTADGKTLVYANGSYVGPEVYSVSLYTNALKVAVQKNLQPGTENPNTGDAKVEGAKYGVYSDAGCTQLVQELITDANGYAETKPLEVKTYYVKELSASEGCKVNSTVMTANPSDAATTANGQKLVTVGSNEDVIYGGFRLVVSDSEDLSGSTTKWPSIGSKLQLVLDSDYDAGRATLNTTTEEYEGQQVYTEIVDARGYAEFTDIPYGRYTCYQVTRRDDGDNNDDLDLMDPMGIFIASEETYSYSKIVNTEVAQRYVKISKLDSESGNLVKADSAIFQVQDDEGNTISQKVMYPTVKVLDQFENADDEQVYGWVELPEKLPYGTYKVYELKAPYGYYNYSLANNQPAATFVVDSNTVENTDTKVTVESTVANLPQKANLKVRVRGNVLSGTNTTTSSGVSNVNRPAYTSQPISGVKYVLTAAEDIVTGDGVVHMTKGQTKEVTTDANGEINEKLYLGKYTIQMIEAPVGYVLDDEVKEVTADYKGQLIDEYDLEPVEYTLVRQEYDLDVTKTFTGLNFFKSTEEGDVEFVDTNAYRDVLIGIYANEDITNVNGVVIIRKDTLVDVVTLDEDGNGVFSSEYPMGKYYAKEIKTNENYKLDETQYEVECKPENNTDERFDASIGEIVNESLKVTKLTVTKIETLAISEDPDAGELKLESLVLSALEGLGLDEDDETEVTVLPDTKLGIYYLKDGGNVNNEDDYLPLLEKVDGKYEEVVRTTDENGQIVVDGLPYGVYAVGELEAPRYYDLNDNLYYFALTTEEKEAELAIEDDRTLVNVGFDVVDEDGEYLEDVTVQLIDAETNEVAYETTTDEEGHASFDAVRAGRYIRKVADLEECYVVPAAKELYLEEDKEVVETVVVNYIYGNILIIKTDDETGEPVAGCKFQVKNEDGEVIEFVDENGNPIDVVSGEDGMFLLTGLRYGKYTVEEIEAAENYEKSDLVVEVEIAEDGKTYEVEFTNVNTGDIAVALYGVIALVSAAAITMTVKKMKRD